jgi:putative Ca2+/H+ antiporter (TMEM165/GDT1 family)
MLEPFFLATGVVAMAEMGDKTQLLAVLLAARLRKPWPILAGILLATLLNHALAASVGYLAAGYLPRAALLWIVGLGFIAFGLWTLHPDSLEGSPGPREAGAFVTALIAFFLVEMGDKTQIATVALAARFRALWEIVGGTTLGMMLANIPAVWLGDRLAVHLPMRAIRIGAALLFIAIGGATLFGPASESA